MNDITIRIAFRDATGRIDDGEQDYALEDFGGVVPVAGDTILDPLVRLGLDRNEPANRRMWTVVNRVFNPRDNGGGYIALVVEERDVLAGEHSLLP